MIASLTLDGGVRKYLPENSRVLLFDDFLGMANYPGNSRWVAAASAGRRTNDAVRVVDGGRPGIMSLGISGSAMGNYSVMHRGANTFTFDRTVPWYQEYSVYVDAVGSNIVTPRLGLTNVLTGAGGTYGWGFRYDNNGTNTAWRMIGNGDAVLAYYPVSTTPWVRLGALWTPADNTTRMFVNGTEHAAITSTTNMPATGTPLTYALSVYKTLPAAAGLSLYVDYCLLVAGTTR